MALNKFNKKTTLQLTLLAVGILLVFLTYFSKPIKDKNQEVLENIDQTKKGIEEEKDTSFFEDVEYKGTDNAGNKFVIFSELNYPLFYFNWSLIIFPVAVLGSES